MVDPDSRRGSRRVAHRRHVASERRSGRHALPSLWASCRLQWTVSRASGAAARAVEEVAAAGRSEGSTAAAAQAVVGAAELMTGLWSSVRRSEHRRVSLHHRLEGRHIARLD